MRARALGGKVSICDIFGYALSAAPLLHHVFREMVMARTVPSRCVQCHRILLFRRKRFPSTLALISRYVNV